MHGDPNVWVVVWGMFVALQLFIVHVMGDCVARVMVATQQMEERNDMSASTASRQATIAVSLGTFAAIEGVVFLIAGLSHTGMRILPFDEPRIVDAAVVEGLCGVLLVGSAVSVFARAAWAWLALVVAHAFTLMGVLVGIGAIEAGLGPHSAFNDGFHRVMVGVLSVVLIVLAMPRVRAALRDWAEGVKRASNHPV